MKIVDILGNEANLMISNDEYEVYEKIKNGGHVAKSDLTPREYQLVSRLVELNIVIRKNENGKIVYTARQ